MWWRSKPGFSSGRVWFVPLTPPTQFPIPKGISAGRDFGWKGVSCWSGVLLAEVRCCGYLSRGAGQDGDSELSAGKSGVEGPGEGLKVGEELSGNGAGREEMEEALLICSEGCPYHEQG